MRTAHARFDIKHRQHAVLDTVIVMGVVVLPLTFYPSHWEWKNVPSSQLPANYEHSLFSTQGVTTAPHFGCNMLSITCSPEQLNNSFVYLKRKIRISVYFHARSVTVLPKNKNKTKTRTHVHAHKLLHN